MADAITHPAADALLRARVSVESRPDDAAAWFAFADALRNSGSRDEALHAYRRSTSLAPDNPDGNFRIGHALMAMMRFDEAIEAYRRVVALQPVRAAAWANIGLAQERLGHIAEAIGSLQRAIVENPKLGPAHVALGNIWLSGGDAPKAVEAYENAISIKADDVIALCNLSTAYLRQERIEEAEAMARRAIACAPQEPATHRQLASVLSLQDRPLDAIAVLRTVLELDPKDESTGAELLYQARQVCDWQTVAELTPRIVESTTQALAEGRRPVATPFTAVAIDPLREGEVARAWAREIERDALRAGTPFAHPDVRARNGPLRIGYLSSDFRAHATMHLIGAMLSRHDRTRVRCHVYSYGIDDGSQHRRSVENAADSFVDLRNESDRAAAEKIHADEIDILIDLKGHTAGARLAIAALRPAPVQVTWLGYPGPVGASFFDYALVDHTVVPPEHRDRYVEGLCYLPNCYQINDDTQAALSGATDRAAQGLPERGFVFASFNRIYKLTGEVLDLWASILAAVPGSLLWLYRSRAEAVESVLAEMRARDVDPARIFFAPPMDKARHLQRIPVADLALDTFPVNGHTTTSDCLKVGLPVVAMLGEHFASRVSASLLRTMGLERLVADDKAGYRKIAIALANEPAMLASIRETALRNRATTPLFDTTRFVGNLETAYETMWRHRCAGPLPRVLEIGERDADSEAPALQMNRAEALAREAVALRQAGRLDDAIARYRESLALRPDHPPTLFRLGNALDASGGVAAAEAAYRHALSVDPGYAPASVNLAAILDRAGRLDDAIEELLAAERLAPNQPEVPSNLAIYLARKGRHREAETALRRLVSIRSADAAAHAALAGNLQAQGRNEEAIPIFFSALALKPDEPVALGNLALSLLAVGRFDEAEAACGRAIALDSGSTDAVSNLGFVYRERGDVERAIAIWRDLLQREPDHAGTRSSLALALLAKGEFEEGWRDYEWRFRTDTLAAALRDYPQPVWDGRRIAGRTLLLDAEQGIGDAIQFLRYAGPLAEMGARVVAEAPRKLHRLLRGLPGVSALIDPADPRPEFDLHAPLMSLPHLCATTLDTIPAAVPYLAAEPGLVARWRERLAALPRPWIGLCWQGNPHHRGDRWRSLPLATLAPLTSRTGGSFVSLQKGPGSEQVAGSPFGARLLDWSADIDGGPDALVDSAAIMANLDLIVTVDTAIAHLAGALGRPVWLMLGHVPDFRWMLDRADSPWYPTMRLWRQSRRGNWSDVVADMGPAMSDTPERDHVG